MLSLEICGAASVTTLRVSWVYKMFSRLALDSTITARYDVPWTSQLQINVTDQLQIFRRWVGSAANNPTPNQIMH